MHQTIRIKKKTGHEYRLAYMAKEVFSLNTRRRKMSVLQPQISPRGAMSIKDFTRWACICRTKVYEEIGAGRLKIHKVGRKTLVSYADAEQWLAARAVDP
jgi:excisionase family DNA binding protein